MKNKIFLKIEHLNARSLFTVFDSLKSLIEKNFEVFAVTESWLFRIMPSNADTIKGYAILRKDRWCYVLC